MLYWLLGLINAPSASHSLSPFLLFTPVSALTLNLSECQALIPRQNVSIITDMEGFSPLFLLQFHTLSDRVLSPPLREGKRYISYSISCNLPSLLFRREGLEGSFIGVP